MGIQASTQYIKGILREKYGVQLEKVIWLSKAVPILQGLLSEEKVDAAELFGDFYFKSLPDPKYRLLFSTGEAWKQLTGHSPLTNVVVVKTDIMERYPWLAKNLLIALRKSRDYSDPHLEEITEQFVKERGGDPTYLKSTAPYVKLNFTLTDGERKDVDKWMDYAVEQKLIPKKMNQGDLFTNTAKELD